MNNNLKITAFVVLFINLINPFFVQAQMDNTQFVIENKIIQEVTSNTMGGILEFYTTKSGGKCIATEQANANGKYWCTYNANAILPQFVLDVMGKNVCYLSDIEFEIKDIRVEKNNTLNEIKWNFIKSNQEEVSFEILKSVNNQDFEIIATIKADDKNSYIYTIENMDVQALYKININTEKRGFRYQTPILPIINNQQITIYPTISTNEVSINVPLEYKNKQFEIVNLLGQKVYLGTMNTISEKIDISNFKSGTYIFNLSTTKLSGKFIKE